MTKSIFYKWQPGTYMKALFKAEHVSGFSLQSAKPFETATAKMQLVEKVGLPLIFSLDLSLVLV